MNCYFKNDWSFNTVTNSVITAVITLVAISIIATPVVMYQLTEATVERTTAIQQNTETISDLRDTYQDYLDWAKS